MVSSVGFVLWIVLAFTGIIAYRRRDDRRYLILTAGGIVGSGLGFATLVGGNQRLWAPIDILPAIMAFITIAEAFGLPAPVAKWLGVGFRSREWEYDRALYRVIARIERSLAADPDPTQGGTRGERMAERRRLIARLRSLQAPTAEWASLTAEYADAYEAWFTAMADGAGPEAFDGPMDRLRDLHRERARLRAAGRANAAAMLAASPAARRVRKKPGP